MDPEPYFHKHPHHTISFINTSVFKRPVRFALLCLLQQRGSTLLIPLFFVGSRSQRTGPAPSPEARLRGTAPQRKPGDSGVPERAGPEDCGAPRAAARPPQQAPSAARAAEPVHAPPFCSLALVAVAGLQSLPGDTEGGLRWSPPPPSPKPSRPPGPLRGSPHGQTALTLAAERGRQQRQEQEQPQRPGPAEVVHRPPAGALAPSGAGGGSAILRRPARLPAFLSLLLRVSVVIPAARDRLGRSSQEPPSRWASQRFNSPPALLIAQPASVRQRIAALRLGGRDPIASDTPTLSPPPPHTL